MNRKSIRWFAAAVLLWPVAGAHAAITCTVGSPGFSTAYNMVAEIAQSSVTVTCQRNVDATDPTSVTYSVEANDGLNAGGGSNRAVLAANTVNYDLYQNSGCGAAWAANPASAQLPAGGGVMALSGLVPTSVNISYWGCVPASQTTATAGIHTDTVTMTLNASWGQGAQNRASFTGSFPVSIFVGATCTISTAPGTIAFNYTSFGPAVNASTTFGATCTNQLPYTMALDFTTGTLLGLNYTLALSAASSTGTGVAQTHTISGAMAAGQVGTCATTTCNATAPHTLTITY